MIGAERYPPDSTGKVRYDESRSSFSVHGMIGSEKSVIGARYSADKTVRLPVPMPGLQRRHYPGDDCEVYVRNNNFCD